MQVAEQLVNNKLIIIEDDQLFRERLAKAFKSRNFAVQTCSSIKDLNICLENQKYDFAIIDLKLGSEINNCESGLVALKLVLNSNQYCKAVILTGYGTIASAVEAVKMGAVQYLTKPAEIEEILCAFAPNPQDFSSQAKPSAKSSTSVSSLAQTEWEHIQNVLKLCSGNISKAAKELGLHRRSLQRKLAKTPTNLK
jgi:two-component system, response regulator RegA